MNIYFCPHCKSPLDTSRNDVFVCTSCAREYPVEYGIPLLGKDITAVTDEYWDTIEYSHKVEEHLLEFLPEGVLYDRVLDLGCGDGRSTIPIRERGTTIVGLDTSVHYMLDLARKHFDNVYLVNGDAKNLPFPDTFFDLIISLSVVEHIPFADIPRVCAEAYRVLKPGGRCLVRNDAWFYGVLEQLRLRPGQYGKKPDETHVNMMTGFRFKRVLESAGFVIVQEDHFPFYRYQKKYGIRLPLWIQRLFATHSNFICTRS